MGRESRLPDAERSGRDMHWWHSWEWFEERELRLGRNIVGDMGWAWGEGTGLGEGGVVGRCAAGPWLWRWLRAWWLEVEIDEFEIASVVQEVQSGRSRPKVVR